MAKQEQIYTIPVNDAFNQKEICPLCDLSRKRTAQLVEYYLGPSLMEPGNRIETNKKGFCRDHFADLYNKQDNRLGLGLMLHTYLWDREESIRASLNQAKPKGKATLFAKSDWKENIHKSAAEFRDLVESCALCDRLADTMGHYLGVIFYQFKTDSDFRAKFQHISGFCFPHTADLFDGTAKHLRQNQAEEFVELINKVQIEKISGMKDEVEYFTSKFDYRNNDKPWGNSRTALPRTINLVVGEADLSREGNE